MPRATDDGGGGTPVVALDVPPAVVLPADRERESPALADLRVRVERLDKAIDVARLGFWRRDLRAGTTEWSGQMYALFGRDPAAGPLSPAEIDACLTPESLARRAAALQSSPSGQPFEAEIEVLALDGARRWLLQRGEAERDASGEVVAIFGTAMDITRRRLAEMGLAESEERFRASLDGMLEGCMIVGRDWSPLYVNEAAARHRHRDRSELLGRNLFEMYPDAGSADVFMRYMRCMESRVGERFETSYVFEDGSRAWYDVSVQPVLEGILVLTNDRTAERLATMERENAAARDRLLVQEGADGIYRIDASGRILDVNPAYLLILGRSEDDVRGHRIQEFFVPGDERPLRIPADDGEAGITAERWLLRPDGRRVLQAARLHLLPDGTILASARDITLDRERAERQEEANRLEALGRLAGGIAHDFNNLMTAVIGTADLVLASTPEADPNRADIEAMREAGVRAAALTRQLLAFGRRQFLRPTSVDIRGLLGQVARLLERTIRADVRLTVDVASDASIAEVDPAQLEEIATNLVLNAQEALPGGGTVSITTTRVEVTPDQAAAHPDARPGPFVRLDVTDNGRGIDAAVLPHIFEPFFTTKGFGHGYGLGLSSVVGIVGQSGGWVDVRSTVGVGSVFSVFLPAGPVQPAAAPEAASAQGGDHEMILLVEDEPQVRAVAVRTLRALGYRVMEAATADEASCLDEASLQSVDLLMTDVVLPDASGPALADRLVRRRPGLRTLFVSGYSSPQGLENRLDQPGTGFLAKPYRRDELAAALRRLLAEGSRSTGVGDGATV